jgi:hypothetical protein
LVVYDVVKGRKRVNVMPELELEPAKGSD